MRCLIISLLLSLLLGCQGEDIDKDYSCDSLKLSFTLRSFVERMILSSKNSNSVYYVNLIYNSDADTYAYSISEVHFSKERLMKTNPVFSEIVKGRYVFIDIPSGNMFEKNLTIMDMNKYNRLSPNSKFSYRLWVVYDDGNKMRLDTTGNPPFIRTESVHFPVKE